MHDVLSWGAVVGTGGSIIAIVTFWMNRGKAESEVLTKAEAAHAAAASAMAKAESIAGQVAEVRVDFARDYASHRDLADAEVRYATALDSLRSELRGMNERLDRIIDRVTHHA